MQEEGEEVLVLPPLRLHRARRPLARGPLQHLPPPGGASLERMRRGVLLLLAGEGHPARRPRRRRGEGPSIWQAVL